MRMVRWTLSRRPPSPASPQPYVSKASRQTSAFPPVAGNIQALSAEDIFDYVKDHNQGNKTRLHFWRRTADEPKVDRPTLLRFMIPDVVVIYISIGYHGPHGTILVENMTAFGPRERVCGGNQTKNWEKLMSHFHRKPHTYNLSLQFIKTYRSNSRGCCICTLISYFRV